MYYQPNEIGEFMNLHENKKMFTDAVLAAKIRHFYDLHFLLQDLDCAEYLSSELFRNDFETLLNHDKETFENPQGWRDKLLRQSPLLSNFSVIWKDLKDTYNKELPAIAFSAIPKETDVAESFICISERINSF